MWPVLAGDGGPATNGQIGAGQAVSSGEESKTMIEHAQRDPARERRKLDPHAERAITHLSEHERARARGRNEKDRYWAGGRDNTHDVLIGGSMGDGNRRTTSRRYSGDGGIEWQSER